MKDYYFVPMNDLNEQINYYCVVDDICDAKRINSSFANIKELKEFSKKFPNIILFKEYIEKEVDKDTMQYLEENFELKHLEKCI